MKSEMLWGSFIFFAFANSFTPGPNIILLASSGGLWGMRRTLPHLLGVCFGFPVMFILVLYGSGEVFKRVPWLFTVLTVTSLLYILWLALRIIKTGFGRELKLKSQSRPMSFFEAMAFQWINGKAWQSCLMTATLYAVVTFSERMTAASIMFGSILVSGLIWIELGKRITSVLKNALVRKIYYSSLAAALLLSTWPTGIKQLMAALR